LRHGKSFPVDVDNRTARSPGVEILISAIDDVGPDDLRDLYGLLLEEPDSESVTLLHKPVEEGQLGGDVIGLLLQLGPEGIAATASALIAWLRYRGGKIKIEVKNQGTIALEAENIRKLDQAGISELIRRVTDAVGGGETQSTQRAESTAPSPTGSTPTAR
jgi:hypothetical protein